MEYFNKQLRSISQLMSTIRLNSYVIAATLAGVYLLVVAPKSMADEVEATLIQSISTSNFPAPDTSGIFYIHSQDAFLITDSEINEMPIFQGFNVFKVDRNGLLLDSFSTMAFSEEPTGITVNPTNNHCFFSDDNNGVKSVFEIDPGDDDICLTSDDGITTSFYTPNHTDSDRSDPEDVSYGLSSLFIADGSNERVYRIKPGNDGLYNGEPSFGGDDLVSSFDTTRIGMADPEGLAFDARNNTLFIVGQPRDLIFQTTINGVLLRTIDISSIHPLNPAGLALAPSSEDPTITNLYLVARGIDNNDPHTGEQVVENDGMIYELSLPDITVENQAPVVSAGADQWFIFPSTAQLTGSTSDDDRPSSTFTSTWSQQSGPGVVSFSNFNNPKTTASFSMAGTYILRLTVDDGELTNFDELTIIATSYPSSPGIRNVPSDYLTIKDAFFNAVPGDTIILAPGTYQMNETLEINKNNISIVSNYSTSGDPSDIDSTIINGDGTKSFIQGVLDQSANLKLIGLTITNFDKGVTFTDDYGEVHYSKFYNTLRDAISFDNNAGGAVTHTRVENAGDDAIDIDTRYNGSFLIAYNEFINSGDDSIEIHLFNSVSPLNMHHDIHDNLFSGAGEDGIQLIDFNINSNRTFDIYRNIFKDMPDVAIGTMFKATKENFQGAAMVERVRIYNNYFSNNGYHITGGDNMIILNNVFENAEIAAIKRAKGNSIIDYNLFYNNPINTEDTVTGGNNLFETDPQRNIDFTLQENSPAIDAGIASYSHLSELVLEIPTIKYGGQNPDIGRYEYNLTAPELTLLGANPIKLNIGDTYNEPGATARDDEDGDITGSITSSSNVKTAIAGSYQVTYTVSDSDENSASVTRSVIVRDNTIAPVITLLGANPINLNIGGTYNEPGATAWDQEDGDLTASIETTGEESTAVANTYLITYTVSDSDGNSASATRSVIVNSNDSGSSSGTSGGGGGGSTNSTLLLLLTLALLFKHSRKGQSL